jgi:hypothetical protein
MGKNNSVLLKVVTALISLVSFNNYGGFNVNVHNVSLHGSVYVVLCFFVVHMYRKIQQKARFSS